MVELSRNAEHALKASQPRARGWSHAIAAPVALVLAIRATAAAPTGTPRLAVALYTLSAAMMLALSAGMHWRERGPVATEMWIRLDHSGIYVMVASATVAVALLGLPPPWRRWIIVAAIVLAIVGLVVEWLPHRTPRGFAHGMFLGGGWAMMVGVVELWRGPGPIAVAWLAAGGIAYTVGAVLVALRRPDPWPDVFGYHEVWHVFVLVAVACHWHLVVAVLAPVGPVG